MTVAIGIREEESDYRAAFTPLCVKKWIKNDVQVYVAPSNHRCFSDSEYKEAGAYLQKDLSSCDIIFGVKEIPTEKIQQNKAYCFFSHTIKGQKYNMPLLQKIIDSGATLIDYEKLTDNEGKRLVAFGKFAGYAGMIDTLWVYGQRLLSLGQETPFSEIKQANKYESLDKAKECIVNLNEKVKKTSAPFICGFTGNGRVAQGAKEIYSLLNVEKITPKELPKINSYSKHNSVYDVSFSLADIFLNYKKTAFNRKEYEVSPEKYYSTFHEYLPYLSVLVNGIYWQPEYPRLVTIENLQNLYKATKIPKLQTLTDITCDINGSIEFNVKGTESDNPCYVYNPKTKEIVDGWEGEGMTVLAVDKLPGEIPKEASVSFSQQLYSVAQDLVHANYDTKFNNCGMKKECSDAVIVYRGELTPNFQYLQEFLKEEK